jgi:hypothetical protein
MGPEINGGEKTELRLLESGLLNAPLIHHKMIKEYAGMMWQL